MIEFILSLPTWVGCSITMGSAALAGLVVYLAFHKLISRYKSQDIKEPTNNLFRVVGMLVSLMLALTFSEVMTEQRTIRNAVQRETVAISDIFEVLKLFDTERTREIRTNLINYSQAIIDDEWPTLADDRLSQRVGVLKMKLVVDVLNLKPANPTQKKLLSLIITDIDALSDYRVVRLDSALAKPPVYANVIIFGFLVTMAFFGAYRPQVPLVVLLSLYTVFVGLVLYLVLGLSDPFQGDLGIAPSEFEYLVETLQSEIR